MRGNCRDRFISKFAQRGVAFCTDVRPDIGGCSRRQILELLRKPKNKSRLPWPFGLFGPHLFAARNDAFRQTCGVLCHFTRCGYPHSIHAIVVQ
jgi:hypothetical protein